jgi:hypothetical protein
VPNSARGESVAATSQAVIGRPGLVGLGAAVRHALPNAALAIADPASSTHVEVAIESAYGADCGLEAKHRMVDARAIADMICGSATRPGST